MATGDNIYVDPSAILKLYLTEPESRPMAAWRGRIREPLVITHHGRLELINGIGLAVHRRLVSAAVHDAALAALDDDFERGLYIQADLLWRATLKRASDISREFTPSIGCRSLDALHVASAVELGLNYFLTFDARQRQLARAVKLKTLVVQ